MNKIEIVKGKRPDTRNYYDNGQLKEFENKFMYFADIVIDGVSLFESFRKHDYISVLGWGYKDFQKEVIRKLLLEAPSELDSKRYEIYVCPLCADLGCGAITINIEKSRSTIMWKDFGLEFNYKDEVMDINIGPFEFEWNEYKKIISSSIGLAGYKFPWD